MCRKQAEHDGRPTIISGASGRAEDVRLDLRATSKPIPMHHRTYHQVGAGLLCDLAMANTAMRAMSPEIGRIKTLS